MTDATNLLQTALHDWVTPALALLPPSLNTLARRQLVLGTGYKESGYIHDHQLGGGPALGFWQMEPRTHDDMWRRFFPSHPELADAARTSAKCKIPTSADLLNCPVYAALMCALYYYQSPVALPRAFDAVGQASMWKRVYNGPGAGVVSEAVQYFRAANEIQQTGK